MNKMFLTEKKTITTELEYSTKVNNIAFSYMVCKRKNSSKELKSDDNTIKINFINNIINLLKSADITLNCLSSTWSLNNNKVSGKNKDDLKNKNTDKILTDFFTNGGRITINDKLLFAKNVKYYHIEKKEFYEFQNLNQFKTIEKDFKKWSLQFIKIGTFIIDLNEEKVYKDKK